MVLNDGRKLTELSSKDVPNYTDLHRSLAAHYRMFNFSTQLGQFIYTSTSKSVST